MRGEPVAEPIHGVALSTEALGDEREEQRVLPIGRHLGALVNPPRGGGQAPVRGFAGSRSCEYASSVRQDGLPSRRRPAYRLGVLDLGIGACRRDELAEGH